MVGECSSSVTQLLIYVESGVTISKSVAKKFFHIVTVMKFEHFKGLTLNLEVPHWCDN